MQPQAEEASDGSPATWDQNRFVPRPALEAQVISALQAADARVVTLFGSGGVGKTSLARHCASRATARFRDGVLFVGLDERVRSGEGVAEAIRREVGRTSAGVRPEALLPWLKARALLLVLDNYEAVEGGAAFLGQLLAAAPHVRLLVTSHAPVGLESIEVPVSLADGMTDSEARELFHARAGRKDPGWKPDDEPAFREILDLTERIPLTLELAAARTGRRTLSEIAAGLRGTPLGPETELSDPRRQMPERRRTLERCIRWSYELLSPGDRRRFAALGVFAAPFSAGAGAAVLGFPEAEVPGVLQPLLEVSLLRREVVEEANQYKMPRPVRVFAMDRLEELPQPTDVRRRCVAYYERLVEEHGGLTHQLAPAGVRVLDREAQSAIAAAELAERLGLGHSVQRIAAGLGDYLRLRGLWGDGEALNLQAVAAARAEGDRLAEARTLNNLGLAYSMRRKWAEAEACFQDSLTIRRELGDGAGEGPTLNNLGRVYEKQKKWPEAEACYQRSLALFRKSGNRVAEAAALNNLGAVYQNQGNWVAAESCCQASLTIVREVGNRAGEGTTLNGLGAVYRDQGKWAEAEACYQELLTICREFGDQGGVSLTLHDLGAVYRNLGRWSEAEACYQERLAMQQERGDRVGEGRTLGHLARLRHARGDLAGALEFARQSVGLLETTGAPAGLEWARKVLTWLETRAADTAS